MTDRPIIKTVAVLGGTGKEGAGLALRWALNGYRVIIGSRDAERAKSRAAEMNIELGGDYLTGMENADAAAEADIVVLTVPYSAHKDTIQSVSEQLSGKILVDVTVPLQPPNVRIVHLPPGKAAGLEARSYLRDSVKVISAFQHVSSDKLKDPHADINCDILICGDDETAKHEVIQLVEAAGMKGVDAGPLENAIAVEAMTSVLLHINKAYKVKGAGLRITNIE